MKTREQDSSQYCPLTVQEAMGTNGNAEDVQNTRKQFCYCEGGQALAQVVGHSSVEILETQVDVFLNNL